MEKNVPRKMTNTSEVYPNAIGMLTVKPLAIRFGSAHRAWSKSHQILAKAIPSTTVQEINNIEANSTPSAVASTFGSNLIRIPTTENKKEIPISTKNKSLRFFIFLNDL